MSSFGRGGMCSTLSLPKLMRVGVDAAGLDPALSSPPPQKSALGKPDGQAEGVMAARTAQWPWCVRHPLPL